MALKSRKESCGLKRALWKQIAREVKRQTPQSKSGFAEHHSVLVIGAFAAALITLLVDTTVGYWTYNAIRAENDARVEERVAREEDRVHRAWSILTTKASGNSGKVSALEYLAARGTSLWGIDLGSGSDEPGVWLNEVKLPKSDLQFANFSNARLSQI